MSSKGKIELTQRTPGDSGRHGGCCHGGDEKEKL